MSRSSVAGVQVAGVASAVPDRIAKAEDYASLFGEAEMKKIAKSTGVFSRHLTPIGVCTSDLCLEAANRLLSDLNWDKSTVDTLIMVTQSPDYVLPATSCTLQSRLGLSKECASFDVNLGCSGYTYGLWLASHLIASGASKRLLLLAGETANRRINPLDRSARPIFGDAGTATALEASPGKGRLVFRLGTNGEGQNHLILPAGGYRMPSDEKTAAVREFEDGNPRALDQLYMNGSEVFLFTLDVVPALISETLEAAGWSIDTVDAFVFHQANAFIIKHLAQSCGIPAEKVPLSLAEFGNTSSASIPLTITTKLADAINGHECRLVLAGFGVGWSWAAVALTLEGTKVSDLVTIDVRDYLERLFAKNSDSHLPGFMRWADGCNEAPVIP